MAKNTDRIEKQIFLQAPRSKLWRALADAQQFGSWFGVLLEGAFEPGKTVRGQITSPGYEHMKMEMFVEEIVPERRFSFRWHPYAVDPATDYSQEPTTLVRFELDDAPGGTRLTVVESGFDQIPATRRARAFEMNDGGWTEQMKRIERHVIQTT
jgi:uncharacterized protein YndB with AHSA1/START domain